MQLVARSRLTHQSKEQFDLVSLRAEGQLDRLDAHATSTLDAVIEDRDVFEVTLQAQTETLKQFHENTDGIIITSHEETRGRIIHAIAESEATRMRRYEGALGSVERLHAEIKMIREEVRAQNAAIERLLLERKRVQDLEGGLAVQERLNAAYATLFKLAIVYAALQVCHPDILVETSD
jgi:hypothetical protein